MKTQSIHEPVKYKDEELERTLPNQEPTPEKNLLREERKRIIQEAIQELPERYRHVILLRHMEEKSYDEIADILGLPLGTVKAQIFRAREMLNQKLKEKIF